MFIGKFGMENLIIKLVGTEDAALSAHFVCLKMVSVAMLKTTCMQLRPLFVIRRLKIDFESSKSRQKSSSSIPGILAASDRRKLYATKVIQKIFMQKQLREMVRRQITTMRLRLLHVSHKRVLRLINTI